MESLDNVNGENGLVLERLFREKRIRLERGKLFSTSPSPKPATFDFSRVEGMMFGLTIRITWENTSESI